MAGSKLSEAPAGACVAWQIFHEKGEYCIFQNASAQAFDPSAWQEPQPPPPCQACYGYPEVHDVECPGGEAKRC